MEDKPIRILRIANGNYSRGRRQFYAATICNAALCLAPIKAMLLVLQQ
jgi:hypothetical protein